MDVPIGQQNINFPGYGMFWVANSITSTMMGFRNRFVQEEAAERNLEFQRELDEVRQLSDDIKMREEIAFKRRMLVVARQYRQKESAKAFTTRMRGKELGVYLSNCWPLDAALPYTILQEIAEGRNIQCINVILMHSPFLPTRKYGGANDGDAAIYRNLEYRIMTEDILYMGNGDVNFRQDACVNADLTGGNASIMNIHFLMNQLPTLVISPRYQEGKLNFNGAVWEPQAARPLVRPLCSFEFEPRIAEKDESYRSKMIDLYHTAVSVIIGTVRDSYMLLTQGKEPTLGKWLNDGRHDHMKNIIKQTPEILNFIKQENNNILAALTVENSPKLLEAYTNADIERMREQVVNINI